MVDVWVVLVMRQEKAFCAKTGDRLNYNNVIQLGLHSKDCGLWIPGIHNKHYPWIDMLFELYLSVGDDVLKYD